MRRLAVAAFVCCFLLYSCSPVSKRDTTSQGQRPFNIDLGKTYRSNSANAAQSPSIEMQKTDAQSIRMLVGYCTQVTGLNNAYLATMDQFFLSFRSYYESIYKYAEGKTKSVSFKATDLVPKLSERQQMLEEQFQAVGFLSNEQNDFVIRSIRILRKRLDDLAPLSKALSNYVDGKQYETDSNLVNGERLMMQINDHCAQFYETHRYLNEFIEDMQFAGRSNLLSTEVDGTASINIMSDLRKIKSFILRLGDYRVDTDDLHELSLEYKTVVDDLSNHSKIDLSSISNDSNRDSYQKVYNTIYAQMIPRINKVIFELESENREWIQSDFNKTMEALFKSYNELSRFYAEVYSKPAGQAQ